MRRNEIVRQLMTIPGFAVNVPDGAFYVLPNISAYLTRVVQTDVEFAEKLLEEEFVAVVPGSVFGAPGHIRMSYASSLEDIIEGIQRLKSFVGRLSS